MQKGLCLFLIAISILLYRLDAQTAIQRALPDPYYPQKPTGELKLNYYYDRTGRWVKFSDWIPFQRRKFTPRHLEDVYILYGGLPPSYQSHDIKERIYYLGRSLSYPFRHPSLSFCKIENEDQYHKYRLLLYMNIHKLIMRSFLRLGSQYDKRHLYFHDLDFADDLEISFLVARSYYRQALPFWESTVRYAKEAHQYPFELDLPTIESERFRIIKGELDFGRIIQRHLNRIEAKLAAVKEFLDREGRPRPVKKSIQKDIESLYEVPDFKPSPLGKPVLDPEWKEKPLFPPLVFPPPLQ